LPELEEFLRLEMLLKERTQLQLLERLEMLLGLQQGVSYP
jgi:hypothetical protein